MTREEAIETLRANYPDACFGQLRDAVDTAISALQQPDVPDTNVGDIISRQAAIDALGEEPLVWNDGEDEIAERNQWGYDVAVIKALPFVDAVEVVRCKDCYHYDEESEKCILNNSEFKPMDYCSYGSK